MSRRHHHHLQPYDFERFTERDRDRDREREQREQTRGIEYQDDSLSSINSDEESYLHHPHQNKEKKQNFYSKNEMSKVKSDKPNDPYHQDAKKHADPYHQDSKKHSDPYHQDVKKHVDPYNQDVKKQSQYSNTTASNSNSDATAERLSRLESMIEQLVKRNNPPPEVAPPVKVPEKVERCDRRGQFTLEPRRHDFTTSMWINKIQETSIQNNWDEKTTISFMGSQMSGIIRAWYNKLPSYDYTWPEWKILITKMFPDNTDFITSLKRLVTRLKYPEESIFTYYFSKIYLIEACKITGEDAVSCLIDGLNNQAIQEQVKALNFLTPETLFSQFLSSLPPYNVDYNPVTTNEPVPSTNWYYTGEETNVEEVEVLPQQQFEFEKDSRMDEYDYHQQPNQNFREEEEEEPHSTKSLPKQAVPVHSRLDKRFMRPNFKQKKIPLAAKVCAICGQRGHLARNCRNAEKMMICKLGTKKHENLLYKNCTVNGYQLKAFVDTGCTTVTIKEKVALFLDLKVIPCSNFLEVYGGGCVPILGRTNITLGVDNIKAPVKAIVVADLMQEVDVIIGQEFLNKKNVCVLLHKKTLKFYEGSSKLTI